MINQYYSFRCISSMKMLLLKNFKIFFFLFIVLIHEIYITLEWLKLLWRLEIFVLVGIVCRSSQMIFLLDILILQFIIVKNTNFWRFWRNISSTWRFRRWASFNSVRSKILTQLLLFFFRLANNLIIVCFSFITRRVSFWYLFWIYNLWFRIKRKFIF